LDDFYKYFFSDSWLAEVRHHRHWQRVMEHVFGCKLSVLSVTLPTSGVYLGGSMTLHGKNLSLACFHGINFRSKSWALFTMEEPYIRFTTDATDLVDDGMAAILKRFFCLSS
jgi:hypothetical protein